MVEFAKSLSFKLCIYLAFITWGLTINWTIIPFIFTGCTVLYIASSPSIDLAISCGGGLDISHQSAVVLYCGDSFAAFELDKAVIKIETGGKIGSG